jgi:bacillithiol system protein YtxJ
MIENHFINLESLADLEGFVERSDSTPVILFKHSATCGISTDAYKEMSRIDGLVGLVVVQTAKDVSGEIVARLAVLHESPQVIILRNQKAVWSASHRQVKAETVEEALRSAGRDG